MDRNKPITNQLTLSASQLRLIAGLLTGGNGLQSIESREFALMLQDIASRLERLTRKSSNNVFYLEDLINKDKP